ncbi:MAG: hypothetical protein K2X82_06435, partial [Gemmataceae bacterium]|nr:hypothetical protein [Gemmataceae bacterium]
MRGGTDLLIEGDVMAFLKRYLVVALAVVATGVGAAGGIGLAAANRAGGCCDLCAAGCDVCGGGDCAA